MYYITSCDNLRQPLRDTSNPVCEYDLQLASAKTHEDLFKVTATWGELTLDACFLVNHMTEWEFKDFRVNFYHDWNKKKNKYILRPLAMELMIMAFPKKSQGSFYLQNRELIQQKVAIHLEKLQIAAKGKSPKFKVEDYFNPMFCKYCGKEVDDDSKFCKHCGEGLLTVNPFYKNKNEANQLQNEAFNKLLPFKNRIPEKIESDEFKILSDVIVLYDSALKLSDNYPSAYLYRGIAKFLRGDITQGLEDMRHALHLKPFHDPTKNWFQLIQAKVSGDEKRYERIRLHLLYRGTKPYIDFSEINDGEIDDSDSPFSVNAATKFKRIGGDDKKTEKDDDDDGCPF